MWQHYSERTRRVIFFAQEEAALRGVGDVGTEHLLLGLLREEDTGAAWLLRRMEVSRKRLIKSLQRRAIRGKWRPGEEMRLTSEVREALDRAYEESRSMDSRSIKTEHLLLGLLHGDDDIAGNALNEMGMTYDLARQELMAFDQDAGP